MGFSTSRFLPPTHEVICDFGAGNGELCKLLAEYYKNTKIICYEPTFDLLLEAHKNLKAIAQIELYQDIHNIAQGTLDAVYCLEVFEHLPPKEATEALESIRDLLKPGGMVIIGVPVEIGLPALYKGLFRMSRRYGTFDANVKNIALSFFRYPPKIARFPR